MIGKRIGLEWEIWANVEDGYEEADSFWPWNLGSAAGNNSVRSDGKHIHQWFAQIPREHSIKLVTDVEDGDAATRLSVLMSSSGTLPSSECTSRCTLKELFTNHPQSHVHWIPHGADQFVFTLHPSNAEFDRRYSLALELTLINPLEGDQEPPSWPRAGERFGQWSMANLRISAEENLPERRLFNKFIATSRNIAVDNCLEKEH